MKKIMFVFLFMATLAINVGVRADVVSDKVFTVVEVMPEFPGGQMALFRYLSDSIKYPIEATQQGIEGRVICQFVVEKDGSIDSVKAVRGVHPLLDTEAVRVVSSMPKWKPGKLRGEPVRVKYTVPINFKLQVDTIVDQTSQNEVKQQDEQIFIDVERMPEYPGGTDALVQFLSQNVVYPRIAVENGIEGKVIVQFVVDKDGSITNVQIVKSVDPSLDKEAKRVISAMPKWSPGFQRGKPVRVKYTVPVNFALPKSNAKNKSKKR